MYFDLNLTIEEVKTFCEALHTHTDCYEEHHYSICEKVRNTLEAQANLPDLSRALRSPTEGSRDL